MKCTLTLKVDCSNSATAKKLASVLAPDNMGLPSDQSMSMSAKSSTVIIKVVSENAKSGFTTVHSVLRDVALFQEIWLISRAKGG